MYLKWDMDKAVTNERKHGIAFREAATVFRDPLSTTFPDFRHSLDEPRYLTIGMSAREGILVCSHTERGEELRLISARRATKQERRFYEEGT